MLNAYRTYLNWEIDVVFPVPLSRRRLRERGYNQAALFALPLALGLNVPYRPKALRRVRHTRSQVDLSWGERRENVSGAFAASSDDVSGKTILLVDDVITTGATLNACASALLSAGARAVYAFSVARTPLRSAAP
jgi:ComF family protein